MQVRPPGNHASATMEFAAGLVLIGVQIRKRAGTPRIETTK